MKKLLIIITLFVSSFFLFSQKHVYAREITKDIDFSIIESVLDLKEKLDEFVKTDTTYSDYYLITYERLVIYYYILPIDGSVDLFNTAISGIGFWFNANQLVYRGSNLNNISSFSSVTNKSFYMYNTNSTYANDFILYSNFIKYTISGHTITYNFQDFSYVENIVSGNKLLTLYDLYLEYSGIVEENPHQEEIDKVTNFYTIVIEKINYLAEQISNNYILLFTIGIFIITFVFLLIFRRFL